MICSFCKENYHILSDDIFHINEIDCPGCKGSGVECSRCFAGLLDIVVCTGCAHKFLANMLDHDLQTARINVLVDIYKTGLDLKKFGIEHIKAKYQAIKTNNQEDQKIINHLLNNEYFANIIGQRKTAQYQELAKYVFSRTKDKVATQRIVEHVTSN